MSEKDNGHKGGDLWQGYAGGVDLADVAAAFRAKYGYAPVEVRWVGCVFLAGPIGARPRGLTARAVDASRAARELTAAEARERAQQLALELEV